MISNILSVGSKAEISHGLKKDPYKSKIMDILDEETLKLSLPIEGNLVIPLEKGWRLELTFWCKKGMYQCSLYQNVFLAVFPEHIEIWNGTCSLPRLNLSVCTHEKDYI